MKSWQMLFAGAVLGGVGVVLGAFGAHGLEKTLTPDMLDIWEVGVRYHMYHALALVLAGLFAQRRPDAKMLGLAGWFFTAGIVLFSGSLYALALSGVTMLGAITPFGGVAFIAGWVCFALAVRKKQN